MTNATKLPTWTRPPDLAYETVHHAVDLLAHTQQKKPALTALDEEENGLTPGQKAVIKNRIIALDAPPTTTIAKNQLENRILAVLQPETSRFLDDADAVAAVVSRLPAFLSEPPMAKEDPILQIFTIQHSRAEIKKAEVRHQLRNKTSLTTDEIADFVGMIHGVNTKVARFNQTSEQIQEVLELAPNFYELVVNEYTPRHFIQAVGKALKNCGEKTKFRRIRETFRRMGSDQNPIYNLYGIRIFPRFSELHIKYSAAIPYARSGADQLRGLLKKDWFQKLEMEAPRGFLNFLSLFANKKITSLQLKIRLAPNDSGLQPKHIETFKTLPLDALDLSESKAINDSHLLMLVDLPKLKTLNLSDCDRVSVAGIKNMLRRSTGLETIILEPYDFTDLDDNGSKLKIEEILGLVQMFPKINFVNEKGVPYRPKVK